MLRDDVLKLFISKLHVKLFWAKAVYSTNSFQVAKPIR